MSHAPNNVYYVCVRATLTGAVSPSTVYNNGVTLGAGNGSKYFSAPASYTDRSGFTNNQNPIASIGTANALVAKTELSGNPSPNGSAAPGEIIRYQLQFTIPQGTTLYAPVVQDNFNFAAAGARLGAPTDTTPGGGVLTCTGGATPATGAYAFAVTGGLATFTFAGNLAADPAGASICTLQLDTRVLNIASNSAGQPNISNDFTLRYNRSTGTAVAPLVSPNVSTVIIEPRVTVAKTLVTAYNPATGQVTFRITITNAPTASTAYNLTVSDPFPAGLVYSSNTAPTGGAGVVNPVVANTANSVTLTVDSLAPGATTSFDVVAQGDGSAGAGTTLVNIANLSYYDLPATINNNNNQADPNSRRSYTGTSPLSIDLPDPSFAKLPPLQTITVMGTVSFSLVITVPAQTTIFNVVVNDTLPAGLVLQPNGLTYVGAAPAGCPAPTTPPAPGNGPANLGNIVNNSANLCTYTLNVAAVSDGTAPPVGVGTTTPLNNTGTFSYSNTSGGPTITTNRTADVIIRAPILSLVKTNSPTGPVAVGNTIVYTLAYGNTGPVPATGVVLTDAIPAGTTVVGGSITGGGAVVGPNVVWNLGTIANGASGSVSFSVTVNALGSGSITNGASLTSNERPPVVSSVTNSTTNLQTSKSVAPAGTVNPGQTLTYSILLTNPLPATTAATNISVTDVIPANTTYVAGSANNGGTLAAGAISWSVPSLAVGANLTLSFQVTVNLPLGNGTQIVNQAIYQSAELTSPNTTNQTITPVSSAPVLTLVKSESTPGPLGVNGQEIYTLVITNTGNENADSVIISDTLPAGTSFINASAGGSYNAPANAVSWNLGTLVAPNGSVTVTFTVSVNAAASGQVPAGLSLPNRGAYSYNNGSGGNSGSGQSNLVTATTLSHSISKINNPPLSTPVAPGDLITYTLTYTNTGTGNFSAVTVSDTVPALTAFVSATNGGILATGVVTWNLGAVNAGQVINVSFTVKLNSPLPNGTRIDNIAGASGTGATSGTVPDITSNPVQNVVTSAPVFTITKANSPTTPLSVGQVVTYTLTINNVGNEDANNVIVQDTIPEGTSYVAGTATGGNSVAFTNNILSWTINSVLVGTPVTLQFQAVVNSTLPVDGSGKPTDIVNSARITGSTQTGTLTTPVVSNPVVNQTVGLQISKGETLPGVSVQAYYGSAISYSLVYTNVGSLTLTNLQLLDDIPGGATFIDASNGGTFAGGGANGRGAVSWSLGSLTAGRSGTVFMRVRVDLPTVPAMLTLFNSASIRATELSGPIVSNQVSNPTRPRPDDQATPTPTLPSFPVPTPTPVEIAPTAPPTVETTPTPVGTIAKSDPYILKVSNTQVAVPGQTVIFTITVVNPGSIPVDNVVVTENMPPPFAIQNVTSSQGSATSNGQTITVDVGTIPGGSSVTIVVTTVVRQGATGSYTNVAAFTGDSGGNQTNGSAGTTVELPGLPNTGVAPRDSLNWFSLFGGLGLIIVALLLIGGGFKNRRTRR